MRAETAEKSRRCPSCGERKPIEEFYERKSRPGQYYAWCRACKREVGRKRFTENRAYYREYHKLKGRRRRWAKFNFTPEEYEVELKRQGNRCKICGEQKKLYVDHDHTTMKYRGLICNTCNSALGLLKDSPKILKKAIKYLE